MIIPENAPKTPPKNTLNGESSRPQPPAYGSYQSSQPYPAQPYPVQPYPAQPYPAQPYTVQTYPVQESISHRRAARRRFFRAFAVAALIWFLFSMFVRSIVVVTYGSHGHGWFAQMDSSVPSDITVDHCISGSGWSNEPPAMGLSATFRHQAAVTPWSPPYSANTSFELPVSSDLLFLLARGSMSGGTVDIASSPTVSDVAKVHVTVKYYREDVRDRAKVCLIKRRDGENGVGIFTPRWWDHRLGRDENLYFVVTVLLPASGNSPLRIKNFETDLPNYLHTVGNLNGAVDFRKLSLKGSNMPITVESLYADKAQIITSNGHIQGLFNSSTSLSLHTSNAPISGSFNSSTSLTLKTSNAPITANIGLENDKQTSPATLIMKTSNGPIKSTISLLAPKSTGGQFHIVATTSNNALGISFPTSPVDSILHLDAKTFNAPATVSLHSAYEGRFALSASLLTPSVEQRDVADPSGRGRRRTVRFNKAGWGRVEGSVSWSGNSGRPRRGSVDVKTSNSPVVLKL